MYKAHIGKQAEFISCKDDFVLYGGARGGAKSQPLDALIHTPFGEKTMGDIWLGDSVVDPTTGGKTFVIGIYPQGKKDSYRITFDDGAVTETSLDHLWAYNMSIQDQDRWNFYRIGNTGVLLELLKNGINPKIPLTEPVAFQPKQTDFNWGREEWVAFIPKKVFTASLENRLTFLHILMDAEGDVDENGDCFYTSTSKDFALDIQKLVWSLGGKAFVEEKGHEYIVKIQHINNLSDSGYRKIVSIENIGKKEMQCIRVSSPHGLYITDDFIVTHNTFGLGWKAGLQVHEYHFEDGSNKEVSKKVYKELLANNEPAFFVPDKKACDYSDYRGVLIRKTFPQLQQNLRPECDKLYFEYGAKWQEKTFSYVFPSGAKISLRHLKDDRAVDDFVGGNYHFMGIDEANTLYWSWIEMISMSVRSDNPKIKAQVCLTANPGNKSHVQLKKKFIERCVPVKDGEEVYDETYDIFYQPYKSGESFVDTDGVSWKFIPALVFENPSLLKNDPQYVNKLKNLTGNLKKMWLFGDWDVFAGQYFDNWNPDVHIIPKEDFVYGKDFDKNTHSLYRFYDYGTKDPFVCIFCAVDIDGNMIAFDEIVETGLAASSQAKLINKYTREKYKLTNSDFDDDIADPAFWTKHSEKDGNPYSPADFYADEGIVLSRGNNDRKSGAKVVYDGFHYEEDDDGVITQFPRIRMTSNCEYGIETIPNLSSKENDPEDLDTHQEDHFYDPLRYGAMEILTGIAKEKTVKEGWRERVARKATEDYNTTWMGGS